MAKLLPFVLKILSGNKILISTKTNVTNLRKKGNSANLYLVNINAYIKFCELYPFVRRVLSGNEFSAINQGHNSVTIFRKMTGNNPNIDFVNIDV